MQHHRIFLKTSVTYRRAAKAKKHTCLVQSVKLGRSLLPCNYTNQFSIWKPRIGLWPHLFSGQKLNAKWVKFVIEDIQYVSMGRCSCKLYIMQKSKPSKIPFYIKASKDCFKLVVYPYIVWSFPANSCSLSLNPVFCQIILNNPLFLPP